MSARNVLRGLAIFILGLSALTCRAERPIERRVATGPAPVRSTDHVVLVALDGVRWQDVWVGIGRAAPSDVLSAPHSGAAARLSLPNLAALAREGALVGGRSSRPMVATGPAYLSMPGYVELMEGRGPTACRENKCAGATAETLLEAAARRAGPPAVAAFASWPDIGRAVSRGPSRFVLSAGRHTVSPATESMLPPHLRQLLRQGRDVRPFPGLGDFRPDELTAELALAYLEEVQPELLFLGLGEPDEYAHRGDYRRYLSSIAYADRIIGRIRAIASRLRHDGRRVTILVTTDHGRAATFAGHGAGAPESARIWAIAAGNGIARSGATWSPTERRLADVTPTVRELLALPRGPGRSGQGSVIAELLAAH